MSPSTHRGMLWVGVVLVFGLGLVLAYFAYCNHRAVNRLDVVGMERRLSPLTDDDQPVVYEKRGVSEIHRVGSQIFHIAKVPIIAFILIGVFLITRALSNQRPRAANEPTEPIDPLAD